MNMILRRKDSPNEEGKPRQLGTDVILAGGMRQRAQQLFAQNGVNVITQAPPHTPEELASAYLNGTLRTGENACDH